MDYSGKRIAVIGMARTGMAVARAMRELGAHVVLYDKKSEPELGDALAEANALGAEVHPGTNNVVLDSFQGPLDLLVPSPGVPATLPVFAEAQRHGVEIVSEIELAYRIAKAPIIAITGTNGKTTTTILTGRMFEADGRETYIAGNVAAGEIELPLVLAAHRASADAVIVAEISTFQLEWISHFRPKVAMLLNVTSDHRDRHATVEEYAALKARIFENQTADDFAVLNAENPFTASLAGTCFGEKNLPKHLPAGVRVMTFARKSEVEQGAFVRGGEIVVRFEGREAAVCRRADLRLRGEHNLENALAACCAATALGVRPASIARAIREMEPVEHRLEPVATIDGVDYINNSMCTNVDAAVRSIEAIDEPQVVILGGKAKGDCEDFGPVGEVLRRKARHAILIGADRDVIRAAAERAGFAALSDADTMREAVEIAREIAQPGDVVVLSPGMASFGMFDDFQHRGRVFKEVVRGLALSEAERTGNG